MKFLDKIVHLSKLAKIDFEIFLSFASIHSDCLVLQVLYHMMDAYLDLGEDNLMVTDIFKGFASFIVVAGGGTVVGIIWGYVIGFVTRFTNHARILEPLFVFTMAYLSYLTAEIFHLSGIMA